jgi:hypothetical protein
MAKKAKGPAIQGFPDKLTNKLPGGAAGLFVTDVESMDLDEMKTKMLECEKEIDEVEDDMSQDASLAKSKEDVKTLGGAYRDTIGCQKAKIKYLLHVMKLRGYA